MTNRLDVQSGGSASRVRTGKALPQDGRRLERSDTVLWSLSPKGIVLHNFARGKFVELDKTGYRLWCLLDGSRCVDHVYAVCREQAGESSKRAPSVAKMRGIVDLLAVHGFIVERAHG